MNNSLCREPNAGKPHVRFYVGVRPVRGVSTHQHALGERKKFKRGRKQKVRYLYKYKEEKDSDRNKMMKINEKRESLKEASNVNIQNEKEIVKRQTVQSRQKCTSVT